MLLNLSATITPVQVKDYASASRVVRDYLDTTGLGNSQWHGGAIYDDGEQVAHVSFNGRVWNGRARDWRVGDAPVYDPRQTRPDTEFERAGLAL